MLPKGMCRDKEFCDVCHKEMKVDRSFLRNDETGIEVWYHCVCGNKIGYCYFNGFIEAYKNAAKRTDMPPPPHDAQWPDETEKEGKI